MSVREGSMAGYPYEIRGPAGEGVRTPTKSAARPGRGCVERTTWAVTQVL